MNAGLSMFGLFVATSGTLWLILLDMQERARKAERTRELAKVKNRLDALKRSVNICKGLIRSANASLGAKIYNEKTAGVEYDREIVQLQAELDSMEDINAKVIEDIPPIAHPIAFGLIALGFVFQGLGLAT